MSSFVRAAIAAPVALVCLLPPGEANAKPKNKNPKRAEVAAAPAEPPPPPVPTPAPPPPPAPAPAPAEQPSAAPAADKPIGLGVLAGIATAGLSAGFGARGGYTFPVGAYVGGTAVYHIGTSVLDTRVSVLYAGAEGGYDFKAGPVIVRPYGGLGPITAFGGGDSRTSFAIWPGATVLYPLPDSSFTLGGDLRVLFNTGGGDASVGFLAYAGARF